MTPPAPDLDRLRRLASLVAEHPDWSLKTIAAVLKAEDEERERLRRRPWARNEEVIN